MIPSYVTHYYLPDRSPFLTLSDLSVDELAVVIRDLEHARAKTGLQRVFGPRYMDYRRRTEAKLLQLFKDAGGKPERTSPHYFVLGSSEWFRGLAPNMQEVRVPLKDLPTFVTSFTYPDSFTAMALGPEYGVPYEHKPYHEKVFTLHQLEKIVERYGMPSDEPNANYDGYHKRTFENYIEVQVWSDEAIRWLSKT